MNTLKIFLKKPLTKRQFIFSNYSDHKYSLNIEDEKFYLWVEKVILPFNIVHTDFATKEIKKTLYEAINSPPQKNYYVYDGYVESYLQNCNLPIDEVAECKKIFKKRIKKVNLIGKYKLVNYYQGNETLFLTNSE